MTTRNPQAAADTGEEILAIPAAIHPGERQTPTLFLFFVPCPVAAMAPFSSLEAYSELSTPMYQHFARYSGQSRPNIMMALPLRASMFPVPWGPAQVMLDTRTAPSRTRKLCAEVHTLSSFDQRAQPRYYGGGLG
jgi:hypothetical protein